MRWDSPTLVAPADGCALSDRLRCQPAAHCRVIEFLQEVGTLVAVLQAKLQGFDGPVPQAQVKFLPQFDLVVAIGGVLIALLGSHPDSRPREPDWLSSIP